MFSNSKFRIIPELSSLKLSKRKQGDGEAFYIRTADFPDLPLGGDGEQYIGIKITSGSAQLLNSIVQDTYGFEGDLLNECENVIPRGYSAFKQPCPYVGFEGDVILQDGLHSIADCKAAFMNEKYNTIAWFNRNVCYIGNSNVDSKWIANNCLLDPTDMMLGEMPEWSLLRDEVANPVGGE